MPFVIEPELAILVDRSPSYGDWSYKIKFDGYRMLASVDGGAVTLVTRNGHDWTERMPRLEKALQTLPIENAWLDGEVVVLNSAGAPDFNLLQNAFDRRKPSEIVMFIFAEDSARQPSTLELARFAAAMQELKDAREAFDLLIAGGPKSKR
jgi:bifunctional non-homologous end joining protein LigD